MGLRDASSRTDLAPQLQAEAPLSLAFSPSDGGLLVLVLVLCLVAIASLAGVFAARRKAREANRAARTRAHSLSELLRTVRMAESIADLGFWQYDPQSGEQEWSPGMRRMFDLGEDEQMMPGDAETLLYANDIDLVGKALERSFEREPFTLQYDIVGLDGAPRSLLVQACNLRSREDEVTQVVAVLRDITDQVSREQALESSRKEAERKADQARELAETDALTGLANRRRVMRELDRLIIEKRASKRPLAIMTFDLDHFKQVNDTHGHLVGDQVLERIASIARGQARSGDIVGRLGGEEFIWILPGADKVQAQGLAERLRKAIAISGATNALPAVTVSVGLAALCSGDTSLGLFSRADRALYDAKEGGRNKVALAKAA